MVRPGRKSSAATGKKRKKTKDDFFEDEGDEAVFMGSDEEGKAAGEGSEDEEDAEANETAEQKRLRLAKAYLDNIKQAQAEEGDSEDDDEAVTERLRQDALDAMGHLRRTLAHRVTVAPLPLVSEYDLSATGARLLRGHRLPVTATALTTDDRTIFSVSKDGSIFQFDVETGKRRRFGIAGAAGGAGTKEPLTGNADWIRPAARRNSSAAMLAAAVSSDGRYFAAGGGDKKVHIWDARSGERIRSFPGHKDAVTALAFREGTHQLFSGSLDRSIKIWSLEEMAYVDTLFGHQAEVLGLDALRAERVLSCGADRTCRVWKVPEESQLVFRGHCLTIESVAYVTGGEWITGSADGSVQLWRSTKKKPVWSLREAHGVQPASQPDVVQGDEAHGAPAAAAVEERGAGTIGGAAATWVGSVAVCRGSDLVASGAGDGVIKLWKAPDASGRALTPVGGLPVRGFVNSLQIAKSGRFVVAGVGQEPRMGRWLRDPKARNGVVIYPIELTQDAGEGEEGFEEEEEDVDESESD